MLKKPARSSLKFQQAGNILETWWMPVVCLSVARKALGKDHNPFLWTIHRIKCLAELDPITFVKRMVSGLFWRGSPFWPTLALVLNNCSSSIGPNLGEISSQGRLLTIPTSKYQTHGLCNLQVRLRGMWIRALCKNDDRTGGQSDGGLVCWRTTHSTHLWQNLHCGQGR